MEFDASSERVIPNQCALLSWESPSNSRQPSVIQTVLSCHFPEFIHEKWYFYPGDCHTRKADWFEMTGNSINSNLPNCYRTIPSGAGQKRLHIFCARFGCRPCRQIPISLLSQTPKAYFGMVMVTTIWLSVSRRSDTAGMPESWILARD